MEHLVPEDTSRFVVVTRPGKILPRPLLGALDIELTERCDNDCSHCCISLPLDDEAARGREMSTARVKEVLDEAVSLGVLMVRITGGEPLVRDDFEEVYLYARRLGLQVLICTNARRVTRRLARTLTDVPPLRPVEVTVYGMSATSYEEMTRRRGSYAEFRRGIDLLVETRLPLKLKGAFRPPFVEEMRALRSWAADLPQVVGTPNQVMFYDLRNRRDSEERNRTIDKLRAVPGEVLAAGALVSGREAVTPDFCRSFIGPPGDKLFTCGIGERPCVDAYGELQPCIALRDPALAYHLGSGSLREAVAEVFPRLRDMRASDAAYLERCARCFLMGLCQQCPARSYAEHGVVDRPVEYQCEAAQAQARRLGLLANGERPWDVHDWKERIECLTE
jgi:radical SAM protein with 4Fe4S-binding SPASM domain